MDFEFWCTIISDVALLVFMWKTNKLYKENKDLHQKTELLQQQLIDVLNKDLDKQDNFSTDPVN